MTGQKWNNAFRENFINKDQKYEKHHLIRGDFPFSVKKSPFYYGWLIILVGAAGIIFSIPGQTMGVSVYTDHLIANLGLSRIEISTAYMIGTLSSSLLLTYAGLFYDRFGARVAGAGSAFFLGLCLVFMANSPSISLVLENLLTISANNISFWLMVLGFLGIRFFGQGVLTLVSRGMVMRWFESHRGFAAAIMGIFTSFGFSYAPRALQALIDRTGWQRSWIIIALMLIFAVLPFILILFRDSPEDCGLNVEEGVRIRTSIKKDKSDPPRDQTLAEAKRDPRLWIYIMILFYWALFNTAFTFHVISIFKSFSMERDEAVAIFLPIAFIAVAARLIGSWLSDSTKLSNLFYAFLLSALLGALSIALPYSAISAGLMIIGMGLAGGLFGVMTSVTWPKLYGRKHLGAISGLAMSFMVAGSALGPWSFSLAEKVWGHYRHTGWFGIAFLVILGLLSLPFLIRYEQKK